MNEMTAGVVFGWLAVAGLSLSLAATAQAKVWPAESPRLVTSGLKTAAPDSEHAAGAFDLRQLPLEHRHDLELGLAELVPGAAITGSGVRLWGGRAGNVVRLVDGFRVGRLALPTPFIGQAQILPGGYGVANADAPEGLIVLESHAPANRLRTDLEAGLGGTVEEPLPRPPTARDYYQLPSLAMSSTQIVSATLAAPLVQDRLFVTTSLSHVRQGAAGATDAEGILPTTPEASRSVTIAALAATARLGTHHRLDLLALGNRIREENGASLGILPEAQPLHDVLGGFVGARWTGELAEGLSAHVLAGIERVDEDDQSMLCRDRPDLCEITSATLNNFPRGVLSGNRFQLERWHETNTELRAGLGLRLPGARVSHRLGLDARLEDSSYERRVTMPGAGFRENNGSVPQAQAAYFARDPRRAADVSPGGWSSAPGGARHELVTLEDEMRLPARLTFTPGLGLVHTQLRRGDDLVLLDGSAWIGHARLRFDLDPEGRTHFVVTSGRRGDPRGDGSARSTGNTGFSRRCLWNENTQSFDRDCVYSGGAENSTVGLPCSPLGYSDDGTPCRHKGAMPTTWEHTLAARHALGGHVGLGLELFYRRTNGVATSAETNRAWNASGSAVLGYRNGRNVTVSDLTFARDGQRLARGATASVAVDGGGWTAVGAYTYARHQGSGILPGAVFGDIGSARAATFDDPEERRHAVRLAARYDLFGVASFALVYLYDSGLPASSPFRNDVTTAYENYRAPRGVNPGTDLNDPGDDRALRLPSSQRLNLQARFRPGHWLPLGMDFYAELINLLGGARDPGRAGFNTGAWIRVGTQLGY